MKKYKIWTIKGENKKFVKTINLDHKYWSKILGEKQNLRLREIPVGQGLKKFTTSQYVERNKLFSHKKTLSSL